MHHVDVRSSRVAQKLIYSPRSPWPQLIEEVQPHRSALEAKAAPVDTDLVQSFHQQFDPPIRDSQVVSAQKGFSCLLQMLPCRVADKMKLASAKARLRGGDTQQLL
jgi:hypothetical protein